MAEINGLFPEKEIISFNSKKIKVIPLYEWLE